MYSCGSATSSEISEINSVNSINSIYNLNIDNFKQINSKTTVKLYKNKNNNSSEYYLEFDIANTKYDLYTLIKTSIVTMLKEFNKDIIEDFIINENEDKTGGIINIYLHSINKDMGISKKYLSTNFSLVEKDSKIHVKSQLKDNENVIYKNNEKYKKITLNDFEAIIDYSNIHSSKFSILFDIDIHEDVPIYMINMRGLLIAKICNNLKNFIEKM